MATPDAALKQQQSDISMEPLNDAAEPPAKAGGKVRRRVMSEGDNALQAKKANTDPLWNAVKVGNVFQLQMAIKALGTSYENHQCAKTRHLSNFFKITKV